MGLFQRPASRIVAIIDWSSAAALKENIRFFQRADDAGRVRPRERHAGEMKYRSLTLWEDGSCELQRFSATAMARRLGGEIVTKTARKARMGQRG